METTYQFALTSEAVAVTECVESGGVTRLCEVGEFMADDVVAQFGCEEDVEVGEAYAAQARIAGAEDGASVGYLPRVDPQSERRGYGTGAGEEDGGCETAPDSFDGCVDAPLDVGKGAVGVGGNVDGESLSAVFGVGGDGGSQVGNRGAGVQDEDSDR